MHTFYCVRMKCVQWTKFYRLQLLKKTHYPSSGLHSPEKIEKEIYSYPPSNIGLIKVDVKYMIMKLR